MRTIFETQQYIRENMEMLCQWADGYQLQEKSCDDNSVWKNTDKFSPGNENISYQIAKYTQRFVTGIVVSSSGVIEAIPVTNEEHYNSADGSRLTINGYWNDGNTKKRIRQFSNGVKNPAHDAIYALIYNEPFVVTKFGKKTLIFPDVFPEITIIADSSMEYSKPIYVKAKTQTMVFKMYSQCDQKEVIGSVTYLTPKNKDSSYNFRQLSDCLDDLKPSNPAFKNIYLSYSYHDHKEAIIPTIDGLKRDEFMFMIPGVN